MRNTIKTGIVLSAFCFLGLAGMQVYADETEVIDEVKTETAGESEEASEPTITYYSHVSTIGDMNPVENGEMTGTEGQGLQMEALTIELDSGDYTGDIEYSTHVANIGWMDYVSSSQMAGTTGQGLQMEAVKIRLTGDLAENYDIYYQAHIADYGWLGWAYNDQSCGSAGYGKRMEALKILLQRKDVEAPVSEKEAFIANQLTYQSHVATIGWMNTVNESDVSGTTGQGNGIEAVRIHLDNAQYEGNIEYSSYVKDIGWLDYVSNGADSGTTGESKSIEAIKARLTGEMADHYDIYYRVHSSNVGWQGWTCSDNAAGTLGYGLQIEAIQFQLISKYETAPEAGDNAFLVNTLTYEAHVSTIGWMDSVNEAQTAGTTGRGLGIEALKITLNNVGGQVLYKSYNSINQWEDSWRTQNEMSGTTGKSTPLEAIQVKLSDNIASLYDIFYRVHVGGLGWLDWVSNGLMTGTIGQNRAIEAIEVTLNDKHKEDVLSTVTYGEDDFYYIKEDLAQAWQKINGYDYYFEDGHMITNRIIDGKSLGPDGRAVTSLAMEYARGILNSVGWTLRAGYDWIVQNNRYLTLPVEPSLGSDWYAQFLFENNRGNCYAFAAANYEMGALMGYDIHQIAGNYMTEEGEMPHSWCEVVIDDQIYILDPNFEEETHLNGYLITYGAPRTLRYMEYYRMN